MTGATVAQTVGCVATLRCKRQIKLAVLSSHSTLAPGQPAQSQLCFGPVRTNALVHRMNHLPMKEGRKPEYPEKLPDDELQ